MPFCLFAPKDFYTPCPKSWNLTVGCMWNCSLLTPKTSNREQEQAVQGGWAISILAGAQSPTGKRSEAITNTSAQAAITSGLGFVLMNENHQFLFLNLCALVASGLFSCTVWCCTSSSMTVQTSVPAVDTTMLFLNSLASEILNISKMKDRSSMYSSSAILCVRGGEDIWRS